MFGLTLSRWTAWTPRCETHADWLAWAAGAEERGGMGDEIELAVPPAVNIPPMLRRRAGIMGRAALQSLSDSGLPYAGQPLIMCSRYGDLSRSLALQEELATTGSVSPQQFSMSVHNATGGLFLMAAKSHAPLTALAAGGTTALSGLWEAISQLAKPGHGQSGGGEEDCAVWLLYAEEPLPAAYRTTPRATPRATPHNASRDDDYYAILLELRRGEDFVLRAGNAENAACEAGITDAEVDTEVDAEATPLDLLRFFLSPDKTELPLSSRRRGGWRLCRQNTTAV